MYDKIFHQGKNAKNNRGYFSAITGIILGFIIISLMAFYIMGVKYSEIKAPANNIFLSQYQDGTFGLKQY
ncbi:MAG TPA: hypothetical protein VMV71_00085, partial [Candidatus Paceibacterota bacterium]|nr:hypothetical protein [Candidatus Paceibacterota bacterium]